MCSEFNTWFLEGLKLWRSSRATGAPHYPHHWSHKWSQSNTASHSIRLIMQWPKFVVAAIVIVLLTFALPHSTIEVRVLNAFNTAAECVAAVKE